MALSASVSLASPPSPPCLHPKLLCSSINDWRENRLQFLKPNRRKGKFFWVVKSVVNSQKSPGISDNGATEPARVLLERLFAQTQKLEEQMGRDQDSPQVAELGLSLGKLESDLQDVLLSLKKKEEDLQDAERKVLLEWNEINHAKKDLEQKQSELVAARVKQEKLEEELRQANVELTCRAKEILDLKLLLDERDREISGAQAVVSLKNEEIGKIRNEWQKKSEDAARAEMELISKGELLDEARRVVEKQDVEIQQLQMEIRKKREGLEIFKNLQKVEAKKLEEAEAKLEKQNMDWLMMQEEMKKLGEEKSKNVLEVHETLDEFERVKKLLSDVKFELVSSQKDLAYSREKIECQEQMLEMQLTELKEQMESVSSYAISLRDAMIEVESERVKLWATEARNMELERELSLEKEGIIELQNELYKESSSLKEAKQELSALRKELDGKSAAFEEKQILGQAKEAELAEARAVIQDLKTDQETLLLKLKERDLELSNANKTLERVNQEIAEIKMALVSKDDELSQAMSIMKGKDECMQIMRDEITQARQKFSDAENVVEQIVDLTKEMVASLDEEYALSALDLTNLSPDGFEQQKKQVGAKLQFVEEKLRLKEMEVLAAQRSLTVKDEELKTILGKLDAKEKEIALLKSEVLRERESLNELYTLVEETVGEKSVGDIVTGKLQLEAARLEAEAATSALERIIEVSGALLSNTGLEVDGNGLKLSDQNGSGKVENAVKLEVFRLLTLTEELIREAEIESDPSQ